MPKKDADKIRVPLNVLVAPSTKTEITRLKGETSESQGEIVDRAVAQLATSKVPEPQRATVSPGFNGTEALAEIQELVRSLPDAGDIEQIVRGVIQESGVPKISKHREDQARGEVQWRGPAEPFEERVPPVDNRPKNCRCRHCGKPFAGPRFSTVCSECKSVGHTLNPAECPRCTEGSAI